uniref:Uncharacterized protein n=1 Tax=Anguilla anguilla TaxID=7936 RepID=A0A0E9WR99_ANGAN
MMDEVAPYRLLNEISQQLQIYHPCLSLRGLFFFNCTVEINLKFFLSYAFRFSRYPLRSTRYSIVSSL